MENAKTWKQLNDLATEDSNSYSASDSHFCKTVGFDVAIPEGSVTGYKSVEPSAAGLKSALNIGPVAVGITSDSAAFQMYQGGILSNDDCGSKQLDSSALAVGYGDGFFKVKNSWGTSWGEGGYVRIST